MAIACQRKLEELLEECKALGLNPIPTKNKKTATGYDKIFSKDDCINCLRQHYIEVRKSEGTYTKSLDWMLKNDFQPMLCLQINHTKREKEIWEGKNWFLQEKIDGNRQLIFYNKGEGFDFYSRNISVTDYMPVNYKANINVGSVDYSKITHDFIIDSEVVPVSVPDQEVIKRNGLIADTQLSLVSSLMALNPEASIRAQEEIPLKFVVFDIIEIDGKDLKELPLKERQQYLNVVYKELKEAGFKCEQPINNIQLKLSPKDFYAKMLREGKEGAVAKDVNAKYFATSSRSHDSWVKIKRSLSQALELGGMSSDLDVYISGFVNKKDSSWSDKRVGAFEFSVYLTDDFDNYLLDEDGNPISHVIGHAGNVTMEKAMEMSEPDPANPGYMKLKQEYYGTVWTIDAQDISSKAMSSTHCRIISERPDKSMDQCRLRKSFLESQVL